jgi:glucose-6-phosphate-specific signal transduction histidine kinase
VTQQVGEHRELQKIADEVRSGRRVILFPPGQALFVGVILLSITAFGLTVAFVSAALTLGFELPVRANIQFFSLFLLIPLIVFPGIMITRGKKRFASLLRVSFLIYVTAATVLAIRDIFFLGSEALPPLLLIIGLSLSGVWLSYRPGFILYCEFFYLVKRD